MTWEQTVSVQASILHNEFENYTFEISATSPMEQLLNIDVADHDLVVIISIDQVAEIWDWFSNGIISVLAFTVPLSFAVSQC